VVISWQLVQATATAVSSSPGSPSVLGQPVTFTATVTNTSGSATPTGSVQFKIDGADYSSPVSVSGTGSSATASVSDSSLGVGSHSVVAYYTNTDGSFSNSDNSASVFQQQVNYSWSGFLAPIVGSNLNVVKAGQSIPVQFSLAGNQGLSIFASGSPVSVQESCSSLGDLSDDTISPTDTAGGSGLQYDPTTNTYTYVWKTYKSWSGTCRQLQIQLADGTLAKRADFQFK
jgi:hypothetical protein